MGSIKLRRITTADTVNIIKWRNNPRVRNNFIYQEELTEEIHKQWLETMIATSKAVQFIIVNEDIDIGSVYFRDIDKVNEKAEYGIFIGEDSAIGKGYGTIACELACKYAFEKLNLHKIYLRVFARNLCAIRSYEKAGFIKEGLLKDDVKIQGEFSDLILMCRLNNAGGGVLIILI